MTLITREYAELDAAQGLVPPKPTDRDRRIVAYVRERVAEANRHKAQFEADAFNALLAYLGERGLKYDPDTRSMLPVDDRVDDTPPPNYVAAVVDTLVARTTESTPALEVSPATGDEDDILSARFSEAYLKWLSDEINIEGSYGRTVQNVYMYGLGGLKVGWDPEAGRAISSRSYGEAGEDEGNETEPDDEDDLAEAAAGEAERGEPEDGAEGEMELGGPDAPGDDPFAQDTSYTTGLPAVEVFTLFDFGWDPLCGADFKKARWAYHEPVVHLDEIRNRWPTTSAGLRPNGNQMDVWQLKAQRIAAGTTRNIGALDDCIRLVEFYERPSRRHPRGFYAVVAGDRLLASADFLPYGRLPFFPARHKGLDKRLPGRGAIPDILGIQLDLERGDHDFRENLALCGNSMVLVEEGSLANELTNEPGAQVVYKKGSPRPIPMVPPPPSQAHIQRIQMAEDRIWEMSGVSSLGRGNIPSGVSGRAIGMAADLEASQMGPTIKELARMLRDVGGFLLQLTRDNMKAPELIRITGDGLAAEAVEFSAADIRSCDVTVNVAAMLPRHMSWKREQVIMMFERGVLGNPQDPQSQARARKMLEFGDFDVLYGDNTRARRMARQDNHRLAGGMDVPPPPPWFTPEDLEATIDERMQFMRSRDYRYLDPVIQYRFMANLAWAQFYLSQALQGVPFWNHLDRAKLEKLGITLPMEPLPEPSMPVEAGPQGMPAPAPMDAFGLPPEGAQPLTPPPPSADSMPQDAYNSFLAELHSMGVQGTPESNAGVHGPGIGDFESSM